jgi:DinB family protein
MTETDQLIQGVEQSRAALIAAVSSLTEAQGAFKPAEGQWSIAEVLEHLYLAELSGIAKIWAALDAFRADNGWAAARPNRGQSIEAIVAATWKANEVAPPIATPHIGSPIQFWLTATRSLRPVLADLGAQLGATNLEDVVFPHFLSGPLDGRQRLEFLRFHVQRHADQIARIRSSSSFPV